MIRRWSLLAVLSLLIATALLRLNLDAFGASGLDPTFGTGGWVVDQQQGNAVAVQADGRIVTAGVVTTATNGDFAVWRYNADGSRDLTFGSSGRTTADFFAGYDQATAVLVQPDGKIVAAGFVSTPTGDTDCGVARFNADGTPDATFSSDGVATVDFLGSYDSCTAVALQADGRIVIAGYAGTASGDTDFALARYDADGNPDPTFSDDGIVTTDFLGSFDGASAVGIDPVSGAIVAAGYAYDASFVPVVAVARYTAAGVPDDAFSGDGRATVGFFGNSSWASAVAIQPADGKIVVGGYTTISALDLDFALARFDSTGGLDSTFSGDGMRTDDLFGAVDIITGLAVLPGGQILASGYASKPSGATVIALARYTTGGDLDAAFGTGGTLTAAFYGFDTTSSGLAVQDDGKAVVVGSATYFNTPATVLARFEPEGGSGGGGEDTTPPPAPSAPDLDGASDTGPSPDDNVTSDDTPTFVGTAEPHALVLLQLDGSIKGAVPADAAGAWSFTFGTLSHGIHAVAAVARDAAGNQSPVSAALTVAITASGESEAHVDPAFGTVGVVQTDGHEGVASKIALQTDGRLVTAGDAPAVDDEARRLFAVWRHLSDGGRDLTFGAGGRATTDFGALTSASASDVAIQPGARIVTVGTVRNLADEGNPSDFGLARYNTDGTPDATFGVGGTVSTNFRSRPDESGRQSSGDDKASAMALQPDGTIVVAGLTTIDQPELGSVTEIALARYHADGTLDETFGDAGLVLTDGGTVGRFTEVHDVIVQPDGKVVVVGSILNTADGGQGNDFVVVRYDVGGTLDPAFGGGIVTTDFGSAYDSASSVALGADGQIVAAGTTVDPQTGDLNYALARYTAGGALSEAFGSHGRTITDFSLHSSDQAWAVALRPDGRIVVVGQTAGTAENSSIDFAIATYLPDGHLDPAFGTGGTATTDIAGRQDIATDVALQPDGKIVAVGRTECPADQPDTCGGHPLAWVIVRYGLGSTGGAPPAPSTPDLDPASDSGASQDDDLTADNTPTFVGTAAPSLQIELLVEGQVVATTTSDVGGAWSATSGALSEGPHSVTARSRDAADRVSPESQALVVTVDTTPPAPPTVPDLEDGSDSGMSATDNVTADTTPTVEGASEPGLRVVLLIDGVPAGSATAAVSGAWSASLGPLSEGIHSATARTEDAAGNQSSESSALAITIDVTAPVAPSDPDLAAESDTGGSATDNVTADTTPTFAGTAAPGADVLLFVDGVSAGTTDADATGVWSLTTGVLSTGGRIVTAFARDAAGNVSTSSGPLVVTIDTTDTGASNGPPVCSTATAEPRRLWPPSGRLRPITISGVTDPDGDVVTLSITRILQDEPTLPPGHFGGDGCRSHHHDDGDGDDGDDDGRRWGPGWRWNDWSDYGPMSIDGVGVGSSQARVRAERLPYGGGRLYEISFSASDGHGGTCTGVVTVGVPIGEHSTVADSGLRYDSTVAGGPPLSGPAYNRPPKYFAVDDQRSEANDAETLETRAVDPNRDSLRYSDVVGGAHSLPPGLVLNVYSGKISGTPTTIGTFVVTLTASDPYGGSASTTFTWTIVKPNRHRDGDGCDHERRRGGHRDGDGCDHDRRDGRRR